MVTGQASGLNFRDPLCEISRLAFSSTPSLWTEAEFGNTDWIFADGWSRSAPPHISIWDSALDSGDCFADDVFRTDGTNSLHTRADGERIESISDV